MGKLQNVVVINGKHYSVDTGSLLNTKNTDITATKVAKPAAAKTQPNEIKKLLGNKPLDLRRPQQVAHHPHHVDLRAKKTEVKPLKLVTVDNFAKPAVATDLAHHVTHRRPKSIKAHKPAATVHAKIHSSPTGQQRVTRPHSPRISHIAVAHHTKSAKSAVQPQIALGASSHDSRRLRAAQHRRHEKISKFAAARRNYATAPPKSEIEETVIKIDRLSAGAVSSIEDRIAASQAALAASIVKHHPRHKKTTSIKPRTISSYAQCQIRHIKICNITN